MTWRSAIDEMPDLQYIRAFEPGSTAYAEWLEKVMDEPWVRALEDMVKWTGVWVGTEEAFFEELRMSDKLCRKPRYTWTLESISRAALLPLSNPVA
jgi:hypothetical protein